MKSRQATSSRSMVVAIVLATLTLCGCGEPSGTVKGKVFLNEKLVTAGSVAFHAPNNKVATAQIQPDGTYEALTVSTGTAKISVRPAVVIDGPKKGFMMDPAKMGGAAADQPKVEQPPKVKVIPIPEKFGHPETSGVTFPVKSGVNEFDIKLP